MPFNAVEEVDNNNFVALEDLARQIMDYHVRAEASEQEALRNAWEAGVRLNQAFGSVKYGGWGKFLEKNCPNLGLTTNDLAGQFPAVAKALFTSLVKKILQDFETADLYH